MTADVPTVAYARPRSYVRVSGPDAEDLLQRMVSNDVAAAESCEALLLTAKGRVIAPLLVWRRGPDDFLLLTEPELGEIVRSHLLRARFAARCEIELEQHGSAVVLGEGDGIPVADYGVPAREVLDPAFEASGDLAELERLRIAAATPRFGREVDERVLPAEAGLTERAVSFTKGCYPGQEPIVRLHHRGKLNRRLRVLDVEGDTPEPETAIFHGEKDVGRITSAVPGLALGYVRVEVPEGAELRVGASAARLH